MIFSVFGAFTAPLLGLLLLASWAEALRQVRRQRAMIIFGYLEQAVRLNLPLPPMLASAQQAEKGAIRKRLAHLRELLVQGLALAEALAVAVPEAHPRAVGLLRVAEHTGTLPHTLRQILDEANRRPASAAPGADPMNAAFQRIYPVAMTLVGLSVMSLFLVYVMPKFEKIFRDFKLDLPLITRWVLEHGGSFAVPAIIVVSLLGLFIVARAFERLLVVRTPARGLFGGLGDALVWFIPLAGSAARDRGLADIFQVLGDATAAGLPLDQAIEQSRWVPVNAILAGRMRHWHEGLLRGLLPADAARSAGLPSFATGLLETARAAEDASAVHHFLARYYRSRFSRVQAVLSGAAVPVAAVVMGAVAAIIALAMFQPLLALINSLSPRIGGL